MSLGSHDLSQFIHEIIFCKCYQIVCGHKVAYGHGLVDKSRCGIGIIACYHDDHAVCFGQALYGGGNIGTLTDDDTVCTVVHGGKLVLRTVSEDNDIVLFYIVGHHLGVCGCDDDLALFTASRNITGYGGCFQGVFYIGKLCMGF